MPPSRRFLSLCENFPQNICGPLFPRKSWPVHVTKKWPRVTVTVKKKGKRKRLQSILQSIFQFVILYRWISQTHCHIQNIEYFIEGCIPNCIKKTGLNILQIYKHACIPNSSLSIMYENYILIHRILFLKHFFSFF